MLGRTESSVLVSLRELGRLEDDRVAREETARQKQIADAQRAKRVAAEALQREKEERAAEDAARAEGVAKRARLEEAELAATRDAAIARATVLASTEADLVVLRTRQAHELRLAEIANAGVAKKWRFVQIGFAAMVVVLAASSGWFVHRENVREAAETAALLKARAEQLAAFEAAQAVLNQRQRELDQREAVRRQEDDRASHEEPAISATRPPIAAPVTKAVTGAKSPGQTDRSGPGSRVGCDRLDPLCGDLPR